MRLAAIRPRLVENWSWQAEVCIRALARGVRDSAPDTGWLGHSSRSEPPGEPTARDDPVASMLWFAITWSATAP